MTFGKVGGKTVSSSRQGPQSVDEAIRELRAGKPAPGYRELSLKIHGHICARCGREFPPAKLYQLTVHHKDNNPQNNPPDGSNWENLCVYCHDDEHSREFLGDYENGGGPKENTRLVYGGESEAPLGSFAELFKRAKKK